MSSYVHRAEIALLLVISCALVSAEDFRLEWATLDAGGVRAAADGAHELGATLGQFDAALPMAEGGFQLSGGFWPGAFSDLVGDCDNSWTVDLDDFEDMQACWVGPEAEPPGCQCFDLTGDSDVDLEDFSSFQVEFSGP